MDRLRHVLPFFVASYAFISCGRSVPLENGDNQEGIGLTGEVGEEMGYAWDDLNCVNNTAVGAQLSSFEGTSWKASKASNIQMSLTGLVDNSGYFTPEALGGAVLAREIYSRTCSNTSGACLDGQGQELGWTLSDSRGISPRFCKRTGKYQRESLERISLQSVKHFVDGKKNISKYFLSGSSLEKIDLKVMPRFETRRVVGNTIGVIINQMAYFPKTNSQIIPFIAVFPQKKGSGEDSPKLWESSFVFSHELGHHLESKLGVDHYSEKRTLVRTAISEGFADLVGFVSLALNDQELSHIPCLSDRQVSVSTFSDGVAKRVDTALMNALILNERDSSKLLASDFQTGENLCSIPTRTAPHGLGALIAHNVYKFANQTYMIAKVENLNSPELFARFFKRWMSNVDASINSGTSVKSDLQSTALAIEATVKKELEDLNVDLSSADAKNLCIKMSEAFSGLATKSWFGQSSCTSN